MSDTEDIKEISLENEENEEQEAITEASKSKSTEHDEDRRSGKKAGGGGGGSSNLKSNSKSSNKNITRDNTESTTTNKSKAYPESNIQTNAEEWLLMRVGLTPKNSIGWFRCGVGFYNKKEYTRSIECFEKSIEYDPLN
eukprot:jgi/Orpsp1_1/1187982/evm.model.d7180000061641.1